MENDYVTAKFCNLRHEEVKDVKQDIKDFRGCVDKKFSALNKWIIALLTAALLNAVILLIQGGVK